MALETWESPFLFPRVMGAHRASVPGSLRPCLHCLSLHTHLLWQLPSGGAREAWLPAVQSGRPQPKCFYFDTLDLGPLVQVPDAPPPVFLGLGSPSRPVPPASLCPLGWGPHPLTPHSALPLRGFQLLLPTTVRSHHCLPPCSRSGAMFRSLHTMGRPLSRCLLCLSSPLPLRAVPTRP